MSEMIERVAKAIRERCAEIEHLPLVNEADPMYFSEEYARAAIEAMREPTRAMQQAVENDAVIQCGLDDCNKHDIPDNAWRIMIDAALNPSQT